MRLRSLLYVPADNPRFIEKAHARGADAIILDLEDSVLPENKPSARNALRTNVKSVGQSGAKVFVRINADIETALQDAKAASEAGAFGIYVSKANVQKLDTLNKCLDQSVETKLALVALIEDPAGVLDVREIAKQSSLIALSLGGEDLATAMGAHPTPDVLRFPRQLVHYAAKERGLLSIGLFQSTAAFGDLDALTAAAREARQHGFDGATCVHPTAVPILNLAFSPSTEEIEWATKVVAAAENSRSGALNIDGQMIDAPVIARARNILNP